MDIQTGKLYNEKEGEDFKNMLEKQIVKLTETEAKSLKPKEIKNMQASKQTMRKIRKRLVKQLRAQAKGGE